MTEGRRESPAFWPGNCQKNTAFRWPIISRANSDMISATGARFIVFLTGTLPIRLWYTGSDV